MKSLAYTVVVTVWLIVAASMALGEQASVLLEKGIYTQETLGDPSAAIPLFEKALADSQADRQVAAQAHFHLAMCYKALKQDAKARELLRQFVQRYDDQEALLAKARPVLEELTEFDPATLMPANTMVYAELGSPGVQLEKVLKMLEGTPFANPLVAVQAASTQPAPAEGPAGPQVAPGGEPAAPLEAGPRRPPRYAGNQFVQAFLNPSMIKEFKKIRSMAMGISAMGRHGPEAGVAVLQPGESDALRGILQALLVAQGQPAEPIEGMQVVQLGGNMACAFDDEVFIVAAPVSQLAWSVRQYQGATESSLATATSSFAVLAPAASRRHDALTVWVDPARLLEAAGPMIGRRGAREVAILTALADVPNMEGVVGRLRLLDNGAVLEATVAYKPAHRSLLYDLIRTPPMAGEAFAAVPPTAAALAGVALLPPGAVVDPSAAPDARTEFVHHVTGLDLGRELFSNIQEIVLFLDTPGEGSAEATGRGMTSWWEFAARSLGVVIVSRDPTQTRAVLDRLLALPETFSGQATTPPVSDRSEYPLVAGGPHPLTVYLTQEGHTTVLSLDPRIRDAAMEALRSGHNARTAGAFAKVLPDLQGDSKVVVVNVGGILRLIDAANPPPPTTQPTSAPASPRGPSVLGQLADACANTTVRLETVERDEALTLRLTASDIPPLKDVFPLLVQVQREPAAHSRARAAARRQTPDPRERNKNLRNAGTDFLAALQKNDPAAAMALVTPGSAAVGKVQGLLTAEGLATLEFQEMRRKSGLGLVLVHATGAGPQSPALLIHLAKPGSTGNKWFVIDVESLPVGKAVERIRELAPGVVPVTREDLMRAEAPTHAQMVAQMEADMEAQRARWGAEALGRDVMRTTCEAFLRALGRRDLAEARERILPGSPAEAAINELLAKDDFSSYLISRISWTDGRAYAKAVKSGDAKGPRHNALFIQLRRQDPDVWRVTNVDYVPAPEADAEFDQFPSGPLAKRGEPSPKTLHPTAEEFVSALGRRDPRAVQALIRPGSPAQAKVGDILTKADFTTFDVQGVRRSGDVGEAIAVEEDVGGTTPRRALLIRLVLVESAPWRAIWRVTDLDLLPLDQAQERMKEPLPQPSPQPAGAAANIRSLPSGTFEIHVQGADLRGVLHLLSTQAHKSVVATKEVTGSVTADLYGVTFAQALEAILKAQGFVYREKDGIISGVHSPAA